MNIFVYFSQCSDKTMKRMTVELEFRIKYFICAIVCRLAGPFSLM
jgi:hypothetical protein